jgi:hypothetical protein
VFRRAVYYNRHNDPLLFLDFVDLNDDVDIRVPAFYRGYFRVVRRDPRLDVI